VACWHSIWCSRSSTSLFTITTLMPLATNLLGEPKMGQKKLMGRI
jgi:hypothetical protein